MFEFNLRLRRLLAFFLFCFAVSNPVFPAPAPQTLPEVQTYNQLVQAIRKVRSESRKRIEQEKVREAWETGKLIDAHVLKRQERAAYGEQVLKRLSVDLGTSHTELKYMLQFVRAYPTSPPADQLSWAHYRELLSLNDPEERNAVAETAVREGWDRDRVRAEVKRRNAGKSQQPEQLSVSEPGKRYTYRVVKAEEGPYQGQLVLDLGFSTYFQPDKINRFRQGDIVSLAGKKLKKINTGENDLFNYNAYVIHVIDGDTFHARIDLGFKITTIQTLRLRALDAPEMDSTDGRQAKEFLEQHLAKTGAAVLVKTVKSDKYDRYLADVWAGETYVNQKLIDQELAVMISE